MNHLFLYAKHFLKRYKNYIKRQYKLILVYVLLHSDQKYKIDNVYISVKTKAKRINTPWKKTKEARMKRVASYVIRLYHLC